MGLPPVTIIIWLVVGGSVQVLSGQPVCIPCVSNFSRSSGKLIDNTVFCVGSRICRGALALSVCQISHAPQASCQTTLFCVWGPVVVEAPICMACLPIFSRSLRHAFRQPRFFIQPRFVRGVQNLYRCLFAWCTKSQCVQYRIMCNICTGACLHSCGTIPSCSFLAI